MTALAVITICLIILILLPNIYPQHHYGVKIRDLNPGDLILTNCNNVPDRLVRLLTNAPFSHVLMINRIVPRGPNLPPDIYGIQCTSAAITGDGEYDVNEVLLTLPMLYRWSSQTWIMRARDIYDKFVPVNPADYQHIKFDLLASFKNHSGDKQNCITFIKIGRAHV